MTIFYKLYGKLYINITNRCCCSCTFCLRNNGEKVGDADSLWLEREPSLSEIFTAFDNTDISDADEIIFCGYGEPMERAGDIVEITKYMKSKCNLKVRVNTNGLIKLFDDEFNLKELSGVIDSISISLNSDTAQDYLNVTNSCFGVESYEKMLEFAMEVKEYVPEVVFTIVDVLKPEQIENCRKLSEKMGIKLRIRHFITNNESYD